MRTEHNEKISKVTSVMPWFTFIGCCLMSFVGYGLIVNTSGLYFSSVQQEFHVPSSSVTLAVTIRDLIGAVSLIFAGRLMKRVPAKILLSSAVIVCGLAFMVCAQITAVWQLYILFAVIGISMVVPVMIAPAALLSNWFEKDLGLVMGIALGLSGIGGAVMNPIIALLISTIGWRSTYVVTGGLLMLLILPFTLLFARWKPAEIYGEKPYGAGQVSAKVADESLNQGMEAKKAFRTPTFVIFVISLILLQLISGFVQLISNFEQSHGFAKVEAAFVVTGIMIGAAVGKATIGALLDRFSAKVIVISYGVIAVIGWIGIAILTSPTVSIGAGFLAGLGQGYQLVAIPWMIRVAFGPKDYAQILSIATVFSNIMLAISVSIHGFIISETTSYTPSFVIVVLAYCVAIISGLWAYRHRPVIS